MRRRTMLQWLASLGTAIRAWSQGSAFPGNHSETLKQIAAITLPASLGRTGTNKVAASFERYVREYRPGADTEHGYGVTRVRPKPPSPAPEYMRQLEAMPTPLTRAAVEAALEAAQVKEMPRMPDGKSVVADLMSFYFHGANANDLCYRAAIQRDTCRGLAGSSKAPARLKEKS